MCNRLKKGMFKKERIRYMICKLGGNMIVSSVLLNNAMQISQRNERAL